MQETRYINQDGICQMARVQDGNSVRTISSSLGLNVPQQNSLRRGDSLTIYNTHNSTSIKISL